MKFKLTTYKTLLGKRTVLETLKEKSTQAIVYKDEEPAFFVDCFDLQTEANVLMNSLVLCQRRSMSGVIGYIGRKHKVNISVKEAPLFSLGKTHEVVELELPPLPEEWLN